MTYTKHTVVLLYVQKIAVADARALARAAGLTAASSPT